MSAASSMATKKRYGLQRVCRVWKRSRSTIYADRHRRSAPPPADRRPMRPGPQGACSDAALGTHIWQVLVDASFVGEGYRKVWAKLRFDGIRTSKEPVRRLMCQHGLQAVHRVGHPHGPKAHDGKIIIDAPDVM